jgi:Spy/CpxP family protein refolding chaperone
VIDELKLTDKQKPRVDEVLQAHHDKMRRVFDRNQDELFNQLKEVLDAEQIKQFDQARERQRPGWDAPGTLEQTLDELKLSDKQKTRVDEIVPRHHDKMRQAGMRGREELLEQMKGVLTEEQGKQFKVALDRLPPGPGGPGREGRGVPVESLIDRVMSFDKNKDGKVSRDELPERMHYLIERGDTNKDGALDREEVKALVDRLDRNGPARDPGPPPPGPGGPPPGPGALERTLDELKLTDEQKTRADRIVRAHHEQVRKVLEQSRQDLLKQMKEVLDQEQFKEFEKALENQRPGGPMGGRRPRQ